MKKNHKFQPTKHTVKALPMAYAGELDIDEINESVNSNSYVFSVNRAVRRYLAIAVVPVHLGAVLIAVARLVQHQRTGGMSAGCWGTAGHSGLFPTHSKN